MTSNVISFCIKYLESNDLLEGDLIQIKNDYMKIANADDVNKWLNSVKKK